MKIVLYSPVLGIKQEIRSMSYFIQMWSWSVSTKGVYREAHKSQSLSKKSSHFQNIDTNEYEKLAN